MLDNPNNGLGAVAGIIYQVYYYLERLLLLGPNESASLEKFDDVATSCAGNITYYQLKHTNKTFGNKVQRMAPREHDLWKTLSMWVEIICRNRSKEEQLQWIDNSEFILLTNKDFAKHPLLLKIQQLQAEPSNLSLWEALDNYILEESKKNRTDEEEDKNDIDNFALNLFNFDFKKDFLLKVKGEFRSDEDILEDVNHILIHQKYVRPNNAAALRTYLYGKLLESFCFDIQRGYPSEYNDVTFSTKYGPTIELFRSRKFVHLDYAVELPQKMYDQTFIRQLVDIHAASVNTERKVINLTTQRLMFENDLNHAIKDISAEELAEFMENACMQWENDFDSFNEEFTDSINVDDSQINKAARDVLHHTLKNKLSFTSKEELSTKNSNSYYYYLSDGLHPKIGWRYDWMSKYNGKEWTEE